MSLSVIITTKDHEAIIERALKSVKFADEILVVDLESSDDTVQIVKKYTDKVFTHKNLGYVEPIRNFSISKAVGDWILIIDADEEVSPGLRQAIKGIVQAKNQADLPDCFYLPRRNLIFKKWIKKAGWWPDYQLRLFRKGHVEWSDQIHSVPITKGEVKEFPAQEKFTLIHHNYQSIAEFVERSNRYSSIQANERKDSPLVQATEILQEFTDSFLNRFFAKKGIEEGLHGLCLSLLQSNSDAVAKMKVWEKQGFETKDQDSISLLKHLAQFKKELSYWIANSQAEHTKGIKKLIWRLRRKLMI